MHTVRALAGGLSAVCNATVGLGLSECSRVRITDTIVQWDGERRCVKVQRFEQAET
jgi:hypothetical protein